MNLNRLPLLLGLLAILLPACNADDGDNIDNPSYLQLASMLPATYTGIWSGDVEFADTTYGINVNGHVMLWVTVVDGTVNADESALYVNGHFEADGVTMRNGGISVDGASAYNNANDKVYLKSILYGGAPPPNGPPPISCSTMPGSDTLACSWGSSLIFYLKLVNDDGSGIIVTY